MKLKPFLTTRWSHLAMLNYEIDPAVLHPHVPRGTELDEFKGRHYVSIVGFRYDDTRVLGLAVPCHQSFAEVNLRFYVRYRAGDGWRRGVVFVQEIVPRRAIALVARKLYDENFVARPMRHITTIGDDGRSPEHVSYAWRQDRKWHELAVHVAGLPTYPGAGSEAEFITEHYWGYTARRDGGTSEYRVAHPPWRVSVVTESHFNCDVATVYGAKFAASLAAGPSSAFLAEGSPVTVYHGVRLH